MDFRTKMFSGRKLKLRVSTATVRYSRVDVDMLPAEAIKILVRIEAFQRKARRDEKLAYQALDDRDYRIGWELPACDVELHIHPDGIAWRFDVKVEEGTETVETEVLETDRLLAALLRTALPEPFRHEYRRLAREHPELAVETIERWLDLDGRGAYGRGRKKIVPLEEEDVVPILNSEDPDVRERALSALGRLNPDEDDGLRSDAA